MTELNLKFLLNEKLKIKHVANLNCGANVYGVDLD